MGQFKAKPPRTGFSRPSIFMGNGGAREWRDVYVKELEPDDIVADLGVVVSTRRTIRPFIDIKAGAPESKNYHLYELDIVKAFVKRSD